MLGDPTHRKEIWRSKPSNKETASIFLWRKAQLLLLEKEEEEKLTSVKGGWITGVRQRMKPLLTTNLAPEVEQLVLVKKEPKRSSPQFKAEPSYCQQVTGAILLLCSRRKKNRVEEEKYYGVCGSSLTTKVNLVKKKKLSPLPKERSCYKKESACMNSSFFNIFCVPVCIAKTTSQ